MRPLQVESLLNSKDFFNNPLQGEAIVHLARNELTYFAGMIGKSKWEGCSGPV